MISIEQARQSVLDQCALLPVERIPLLDALGRVLAEDVCSDMDIAPFDNSSMDGFAVRSADGSAERRVVDNIAAGSVPQAEVGPGEAARIMTGAPMPSGADAVLMVEHTVVVEGDGGIGSCIRPMCPVSAEANVRYRGEDVRAGAVVLPAGTVVTAPAVGLLAATGNSVVAVRRRPRVAVLSTGDELVEIHEKPGPGQIRNSNTAAIAAQVLEAGGIPVIIGIVRDTKDATHEAFLRAAENDFIVVSGGVSVGDFDQVRPVLASMGRIIFHQVDMRPGFHLTFGVLKGVPLFGLPGNPTSAFVGFEMLVRPTLRWMQGFTALDRPRVTAILDKDIRKKPDQPYFHRAVLRRASDGSWHVGLAGSQSSALLTPAVRANALMFLPKGEARFSLFAPVTCIRLDVPEGSL